MRNSGDRTTVLRMVTNAQGGRGESVDWTRRGKEEVIFQAQERGRPW